MSSLNNAKLPAISDLHCSCCTSSLLQAQSLLLFRQTGTASIFSSFDTLLPSILLIQQPVSHVTGSAQHVMLKFPFQSGLEQNGVDVRQNRANWLGHFEDVSSRT